MAPVELLDCFWARPNELGLGRMRHDLVLASSELPTNWPCFVLLMLHQSRSSHIPPKLDEMRPMNDHTVHLLHGARALFCVLYHLRCPLTLDLANKMPHIWLEPPHPTFGFSISPSMCPFCAILRFDTPAVRHFLYRMALSSISIHFVMCSMFHYVSEFW